MLLPPWPQLLVTIAGSYLRENRFDKPIAETDNVRIET